MRNGIALTILIASLLCLTATCAAVLNGADGLTAACCMIGSAIGIYIAHRIVDGVETCR